MQFVIFTSAFGTDNTNLGLDNSQYHIILRAVAKRIKKGEGGGGGGVVSHLSTTFQSLINIFAKYFPDIERNFPVIF